MTIKKNHIVLSDLHGNLKLYDNALRESGYQKGRDVLVIAGDWMDIGEDSEELWKRIEAEADVILLGNHELAHIIQQEISPYDNKLDFTSMPLEIAEAVRDGQIKLAYVANDEVLITHAGVSEALINSTMNPQISGLRNVQQIADALNMHFINSLSFDANGMPSLNEQERWFAHSNISPLWWRPLERGLQPAKGLKQMAGHTPAGYYTSTQQRKLKEAGFILVDPYVAKHFHKHDFFVYGTISVDDDDVSKSERVSYSRSGVFKMVNPGHK